MSARSRIAILGGTGYGGAELLRLLLAHPHVEVIRVTSRQRAGDAVGAVHRNLFGVTELTFESPAPAEAAAGADLVISALPHGASQTAIRALPGDVRVIDLSGDFRLDDPIVYEAAYGRAHEAPGLLADFVYGLTEFDRERVATARRVANPGCFATATLLALMPLARAGLLNVPVGVSGVTGSSGSGAEPKPATHHPERAQAFRAYRPLVHQHLAEIREELGRAGAHDAEIAFVPHSAPFVRGIHVTAFLHAAEPFDAGAVREAFESAYRSERFVRLVPEPPDVSVVAGSNFADVWWKVSGRELVVLVAIDNLVKGMAGQAVQNMNLMLGHPEAAGLAFPGTRP